MQCGLNLEVAGAFTGKGYLLPLRFDFVEKDHIHC